MLLDAYKVNCEFESDINEHLPVLYEYTKKCSSVVECGVRNIVSSHVFEILPFDGKRNVYDYHCMSLCMRHNYTQLDCEDSPWSLGPRTRTLLESALHLIISTSS